jgi:hypothetical protein
MRALQGEEVFFFSLLFLLLTLRRRDGTDSDSWFRLCEGRRTRERTATFTSSAQRTRDTSRDKAHKPQNGRQDYSDKTRGAQCACTIWVGYREAQVLW